MAEKSSFFTSLNGDRKYKSSDFAEYFATFIGNGVFPNPSTNLLVTSNGDMTINLSPGFAWINGYMYHNTDNLTLTVSHSDSALKRIDRVVLRCDFISREIKVYIKEGVFASSSVAPILERSANAYELAIAEILVEAGVTSIFQSKITDTRLDATICGIVTQTVETIDTTELYNKLQAYIDERGQDVNGWIDEATRRWEVEFKTWFNTIKDVLDGDIAGALANRILELENKVGSGLTADNILMPDGSSVKTSILGIKDSVKSVVNSVSETDIASSKAVKIAYDKGTEALNKANEAFQNANNGKNIVATAIGSPLSSADTFATMGSKIDGITNKFKDILQDKGISISSNDKYNSLVDKTSLLALPKISIVGDDVVLYSNPGYFQAKGSPDESVVYISKELFLRGSIRIKMTADGNQQTASYKIKYRIVNEEGLVKSEKVYTINRNDVLSMTTEFDNIEPYDKVELIYICPTSWQCQSKDLIISCNYA